MKATQLIQILVDRVAANGDLEVFLSAKEAGQYSRLHDAQVGMTGLHRMKGRQTAYIDAGKGEALGYDPQGASRGIVLG